MITEIELRNWKAHENTSLSFNKGVNVLVGIMGAGKSSVIDAISFGLFGTFPALKQRRIKTEQLIKSRPKKADNAEIKISFISEDDVYTVTRQISASGSTSALLEKNGIYLQTQPIRVNEEISSILKIDYDTFARAVYSEQNGLDYFLNITKSERKRQIDNMLGLDYFARAEENCTSFINSVRALISDSEETLSHMDRGKIEKEFLEKKAERDTIILSQKSIENKMEEIKKRVEISDSAVKNLRKLLEKKESLSSKLIALKSRMQILESEILKIKNEHAAMKVDDAEKSVQKSEMLINKIKSEDSDLSKKAVNLQKKNASVSAAIDECIKKLEERDTLFKKAKITDEKIINAEINTATKKLETIIASKESASGKITEIKEGITALQKHIASCPVCERTIDEQLRNSLLAKRAAELSQLEGLLKKALLEETPTRQEISKLESEKVALKLTLERLKDFSGIDEKIPLLKKENEAILNELAIIDERRRTLSKDAEKAQKELDAQRAELEAAKRMARHYAELESCKKESALFESEIGKIDADPKKLDEMATELSENIGRLTGFESTVSSYKKHIVTLDFAVDSLSKQLAEIDVIEKRISGRRALLSDLGVFKSALAETSSELRLRLIRSINNLMSSIWSEIYPYNDYGRLALSASAEDYALEVEVEGDGGKEMVLVDSVASGGERSTACLALRVALSMTVVPNLKWLILDEPTHNLDSYGVSSLIETLGDELPKVVDQVFIITHDESMKQIASAKVYQFDRDKASGGSAIVSEAQS